MNLLPIDLLGARESSPGIFDFGILLPGINPTSNDQLSVKIIHERDQFLQAIPPLVFPLTHSVDPVHGDFWSASIPITAPAAPAANSAWGQPGRYVYRYELDNPALSTPLDWIIDPYAREFGTGQLSAITMGYVDHSWSANETQWRIPPLSDLVIYEMMLAEFGGSLSGARQKLDYVADLGINCIEVMPVSNTTADVDWGYTPLGYFGLDERYGSRNGFQQFVDEAHQRGIAVILDSVYAHTADRFTYEYVYSSLGRTNPFMGAFAGNAFGRSTDFTKPLVRDFFLSVNAFWLDRCHVDGFRYDYVPGFWDGPDGDGYATLVYETYQHVKKQQNTGGHWQRFFDGANDLRLIQCAEQLEAPREVLRDTYSNCTWQNETLYAARGVAQQNRSNLELLGLRLGLDNYPATITSNGDTISKSALQYIETHDHERFVCNYGLVSRNNEDFADLFREGNRDEWFKVQPHLIAILMAKGIPLLWQGQEFGENYWLPGNGLGRINLLRPLRWDYFYDSRGRSMISLTRKLLRLRQQHTHLRTGDHFFYNHYERYQSKNVLLFSRYDNARFTLIALNFSNVAQTVPFWFPISGNYQEELHGQNNLANVTANVESSITIPSHYGRIWTV